MYVCKMLLLAFQCSKNENINKENTLAHRAHTINTYNGHNSRAHPVWNTAKWKIYYANKRCYWIFTPFLVAKCLTKLIRFYSLTFPGSCVVLGILSVVCHSGHLYYDVRRKRSFCYCPTETNIKTLWTLLLWIQNGKW